jgi:predicted nucleotidyltransferase
MSQAKILSHETDPQLAAIAATLKRLFLVKRIYLFGSRAQGTARPDSDYDLVVVVDSTNASRLTNMQLSREALRSIGIRADVFVYSEAEFNEWKDELSSIPETALNTGIDVALG